MPTGPGPPSSTKSADLKDIDDEVRWHGPFLIDGDGPTTRGGDDAGATEDFVSNHAGNNLDGTPASAGPARGVAAASRRRRRDPADGGIRRGGDVKALALGARAVMIGRPCLGLAAGYSAGCPQRAHILRAGIDSALPRSAARWY